MLRFLTRYGTAMFAAGVLALSGCVEQGDGDAVQPADSATAAASVPAGQPAPGTAASPSGDSLADPSRTPPAERPRTEMRIEVNLAARELYVYQGDQRTRTYPVAVGSSEWPTETGEWTISQVVWNPEWVPPDETWAEDSERKAPGAPDNPLGRAQLVYDLPRTIHGTNDPESIGKAVSHGSLRMRNDDITQLARDVMEDAGAERDDAWYRRVQENRTEKQIVDLPSVVPIRVYEGG